MLWWQYVNSGGEKVEMKLDTRYGLINSTLFSTKPVRSKQKVEKKTVLPYVNSEQTFYSSMYNQGARQGLWIVLIVTDFNLKLK